MLLFRWHNKKLKDFELDIIVIDEKYHVNILIYDISYETLIDPKKVHIRSDKIDRLFKIYDAAGYLTLFGSEKIDDIYDKIK